MKNFIARISGTKDLTEGKPSKLILNFGLPLLFGLCLLYTSDAADEL